MDQLNNIGYFRLVDKNTGKIIRKYSYDKISAKERKDLKTELEKKTNLGIYCDCTQDNIELKIASNLVIYNYQRNIGERHHPNCPKYKDTDLVSWTYSQKEKAYKAGTYNTAQDYVTKINEFIFKNNIVNFNIGLKKIKEASYKLITDKGEKLYYIINPDTINVNKIYFNYGFIGKMQKLEGRLKNFILITIVTSKEPFKSVDILANWDEFNIYYSQNRYYTTKENHKPLLIGGWFTYDIDLKQNIFSDFWLKATDNTGKIF